MTAAENLTSALAAVQADLPQIAKTKTANVRSDKGSYSYSYADLSDILPAVLPLMARHGLAFVTMPTTVEEHFALVYELRHVSGESIRGEYPLPDPTRVSAQQVGSAVTYARRYIVTSLVGIAPDEDDDGRLAAQPEPRRPKGKRADRTPVDPSEETPWTTFVPVEQMLAKVAAAPDVATLRELWKQAALVDPQFRDGYLAEVEAAVARKSTAAEPPEPDRDGTPLDEGQVDLLTGDVVEPPADGWPPVAQPGGEAA